MFWYGLAALWICLQFLANMVENSSSFVSTRSVALITAEHTGEFPVESARGFGDSGTLVVGVERMEYRSRDSCPMAHMVSADYGCVDLVRRGAQTRRRRRIRRARWSGRTLSADGKRRFSLVRGGRKAGSRR